MGLGQWSYYLKTPLQTFDTATAVGLIAPHLRIILGMASDLLGGGARMGGEGREQGWRQELNFQTQKDRMKPLS